MRSQREAKAGDTPYRILTNLWGVCTSSRLLRERRHLLGNTSEQGEGERVNSMSKKFIRFCSNAFPVIFRRCGFTSLMQKIPASGVSPMDSSLTRGVVNLPSVKSNFSTRKEHMFSSLIYIYLLCLLLLVIFIKSLVSRFVGGTTQLCLRACVLHYASA